MNDDLAGFPPGAFGIEVWRHCKVLPRKVRWINAKQFWPHNYGVVYCPCQLEPFKYAISLKPPEWKDICTQPIMQIKMECSKFRFRSSFKFASFYHGQCEHCGTVYLSIAVYHGLLHIPFH